MRGRPIPLAKRACIHSLAPKLASAELDLFPGSGLFVARSRARAVLPANLRDERMYVAFGTEYRQQRFGHVPRRSFWELLQLGVGDRVRNCAEVHMNVRLNQGGR